ncbi:bifunctional 4-hydroxy-2-oxoglutarate aldolase/2-dehydro-3-deoxy-phosphogluconate aldolase [Chitinophaga ginsengisegetis]|uniref:bifunctional 4-hydroxy-2-oxoglutarate aldolase/2-dehydro-3-deoxy-phosphogluconate aldolase n=1 Tax=Chitinophaga ginsengisegetis TaxID=393003 RepID=UPI000DB8FB39|nr:bifunctional 4-hydroxy-2-oxoglutarate aldolase/2-dehydro-3-deoxy-phosphogluconate aldolase [Chitinophaga ginsengisegetis]MDR6570664.1 2-dehydro-3-deoxyphosphogluconate aldolase/(4S)-4-hydroxy-2-oxoglutarate aldolase [Chitinophaga ginsengisegetis]MDR6650398.1 2-dehydro-3-deoxyphosphogluconate aldolase/(4S)-4-hydroxy-2-oxoglutarate aldolase [Chitinophaga ginsengisegetis]MDR6656963.1 2-dehydro-3-deoxyphosphogluconate aldolase/(4S)-4-hydroxy-2-oxoglutarate aldolase [Chitinophaga ginsengisegetis]
MSTLSQILEHKIIAIIRGVEPADVLRVAEAIYAGGIRLLEVTMNSSEPLAVIKEVSAKMGDKMIIGAGTVLDAATTREAVAAGARFILSPILEPEVIKTARELGVVSIPGAYTATEVYAAYKQGADMIKVFPATSAAYIKDISAPLPKMHLLPTGGITPENIRDFQKAGAAGFGIGSALVNANTAVTPEYLQQLAIKAQQFIRAIQS